MEIKRLLQRSIPVLVVIAQTLAVLAAVNEPKGAVISLRAKWEGTPYLLEACEFLADEGHLWPFLDSWEDRQSDDSHSCWEQLAHHAAKVANPSLARVLQVVLGTRQYTARLEMFRTLAAASQPSEGVCNWVEIAGKTANTPAELEPLLDGLSRGVESLDPNVTQTYAFDHTYPGSGGPDGAGAGRLPAIVYGAVGTPGFRELHNRLKEAANSLYGGERLQYVHRPVLMPGCGQEPRQCLSAGTGELQLPGFGVELAIKNMEYSAINVEEPKATEGAAESTEGAASQQPPPQEDGPSEVSGFLFDRLVGRRPELKQELLTFRDSLLAASSEEQTLKVWDLKDLGLQAAGRIMAASDPLQMLAEISQNFPTLVASLSRLPVSAELRAEVAANQQAVGSAGTVVLLNGLPLDAARLDLYDVMDRIRHEVRLGGLLNETGLQEPDIAALLAARAGIEEAGGADLRVDLQPLTGVQFLNNLEVDREYARWSPRLSDLLMPTFPGRVTPIARNAFTSVLLIDPATPTGLRAAATALGAWRERWPMRMGLTLLPASVMRQVAAPGGANSEPLAWEDADAGERIARAFVALQGAVGPHAGAQFLTALGDALGVLDEEEDWDGSDTAQASAVSWSAAERVFKEIWQQEAGKRAVSAEEVLAQLEAGEGVAEDAAEEVLEGAAFIHSKGLAAPVLWCNGLVLPLESGTEWRGLMMWAFQTQMRAMQEAVYFNRITDNTPDILSALLKQAGAVPRHNPRILGDTSEARQVALTQAVLAPLQEAAVQLGYLHFPGTEDDVKPISHWVVADLETKAGRDLVLEGLRHLGDPDTREARLAILHNPANPDAAPSPLVRAALAATLASSRRTKIAGYLKQLLKNEAILSPATSKEAAVAAAISLAESAGLNAKALETALGPAGAASEAGAAAHIAAQSKLCREGLGLAPGEAAAVTNGRVVAAGPQGLVAEDFGLMELHAQGAQPSDAVFTILEAARAGGRTVAPPAAPAASDQEAMLDQLEGDGESETVEAEEMSSEQLSEVALVASSILAAVGVPEGEEVTARTKRLSEALGALQGAAAAFDAVPPQSPADGSHPRLPLELTVLLNPLAKPAQRIAPFLLFLRSTLGARMRVYLNPDLSISDMPLKSFYRLALPEMAPAPGGYLLSAPPPPAATFSGLLPTRVLTLNLDAPEAWLAEPVAAPLDLDNLRLADLGPGRRQLEAAFELEALMLTGSCIDVAAKKREQVTPRGVQLHLGTAAQPRVLDTMVMSNLGYFQLKASPGVWTLSLAPGRSRQLYEVAAASGVADELSNATLLSDIATPAVVASLQGKNLMLRVRKRPGMDAEDVLADPTPGSGYPSADPNPNPISRLASWLKGGGNAGAAPGSRPNALAGIDGGDLGPGEDNEETVHVFTVASGHMYERLQKIMVLSVIRTTKSRVKFWFIKNYMSPQMREFVPRMAAHYGFDYAFVTYRWPHWLHKQTEKQRIIWAYKILFLDVLFPLSLRKVIFVDADQVVRGDMRELWDMDLKGAPLGYVPFCDNNRDMDGFRFWRQGFWADHLRGKPYHISALYVVDLARFRQMAAGDTLRVLYDQLSRDANSLANLDQDLPNYAQHSVPIFSLPQEWLWCETWCGNSTKAAAKTIDLCNNPLTKEPKLVGARRIIAEWPQLDAEAREFTARVEAELSAGVAADRRGVGAASPSEEVAEGDAASGSGAVVTGGAKEGASEDDGEVLRPPHDPSEL